MSDMIFPGTATPAQVLANQTFSAGTNYGATGTMPNNGALGTITPGTAPQTVPAGYTSGGTVAGDPNLVAAKILAGTSIFGVAGSAKRQASGTATITSATAAFYTSNNSTNSELYLTITGLTFQPSRIVVVTPTTTNNTCVTVYDASDIMIENTYPCHCVMANAGTTSFYQNTGALSVTATGFTLPFQITGNCSWYAYE